MLVVTEAEESDIPYIAEIEAASFSEPWSERGFLDALHMEHAARIFVAFFEEDSAREKGTPEDASWIEHATPVGYLVFYFSPPVMNLPGEGNIETVAVHKGYQGHGIGHALVQEMKRFSKEHGIEDIYLEVRPSNASARALYESEGFIETGIRKNFYRLPDEDAILMKGHIC